MTFINTFNDRTDFDFDVQRERLRLQDGQDTGLDALVRRDRGTILSVVTPKYEVITHKDANAFAEDLFDRNGLVIEPGHISVNTTGSRFLREFRITNKAFIPGAIKSTAIDNDGARNDTYFPTVILRNSYDRSSRLEFIFGAYRLVCANGMVVGQEIQRFRFKHNQTPDFQKIGNLLLSGIEATVDGFKRSYDFLNSRPADAYIKLMFTRELLNKRMAELMAELSMGLLTPEYGSEGELVGIAATRELSAYALMQITTEIATHRLRKYSRSLQMQQNLAKVFAA